MGADLIFWVEASREIGMGHLMECLALATEFSQAPSPPIFAVSNYPAAVELIESRGFRHISSGTDSADAVVSLARAENIGTVVVNHRSVKLLPLRALRSAGLKICVVDQMGKKPISADVLVNSTMIGEWLRYEFPDGSPECLFGAEFAPLRKEFAASHESIRRFPSGGGHVLVCMGGVDRTGATMRLVEALRPLGTAVKKEFILGKGFAHFEEFSRLIAKADTSFSWRQNVSDLASRFLCSDIAFSAGGNTLYELACTGTPALVLWEDPHENLQGAEFQRHECAINLGNGISTAIEEITIRTKNLLGDSKRLEKMSKSGRTLVDGRGLERVCSKIALLDENAGT